MEFHGSKIFSLWLDSLDWVFSLRSIKLGELSSSLHALSGTLLFFFRRLVLFGASTHTHLSGIRFFVILSLSRVSLRLICLSFSLSSLRMVLVSSIAQFCLCWLIGSLRKISLLSLLGGPLVEVLRNPEDHSFSGRFLVVTACMGT